MKEIRNHLIADSELVSLLGGQYIWLVEKPDKVITDNYIIFNYKEIGKNIITDYQFELNIIVKDLNKGISIKDRVIKILDNERNNVRINGIKQTYLLNGGGMAKNPDTGNFEIVVFFNVKI